TPCPSRRSARLLPMKPAPPVMHARLTEPPRATLGWRAVRLRARVSWLEREARRHRVAVEHPHGLERVLLQVLAEAVDLLEQIVGHRGDVTANAFGQHEIEDL